MIILILWVIFVGLLAMGGKKVFEGKGQSGTVGMLVVGVIAFFFSPLIGAVALLICKFAVPDNNKVKNMPPNGYMQPNVNAAYFNSPAQTQAPPVQPVQAYTPPQPSQSVSKPTNERVERLRELELLKEEGLVSEHEYNEMRSEILKS